MEQNQKFLERTSLGNMVDGHAVLSGAVAVTAKGHTAPITLGRGGAVRVCQTSIVHLTESKATPATNQLAAPLLLSLDRGAIEIQMNISPTDAVMTADGIVVFRGAAGGAPYGAEAFIPVDSAPLGATRREAFGALKPTIAPDAAEGDAPAIGEARRTTGAAAGEIRFVQAPADGGG